MTDMSGTMTAVIATMTAVIATTIAVTVNVSAPEALMIGSATSRMTEIAAMTKEKGMMMSEEMVQTAKKGKVGLWTKSMYIHTPFTNVISPPGPAVCRS